MDGVVLPSSSSSSSSASMKTALGKKAVESNKEDVKSRKVGGLTVMKSSSPSPASSSSSSSSVSSEAPPSAVQKLTEVLMQKKVSLEDANERMSKLGFSDDVIEQYTGKSKSDKKSKEGDDVMTKLIKLQEDLTHLSSTSRASTTGDERGRSVGGLKVATPKSVGGKASSPSTTQDRHKRSPSSRGDGSRSISIEDIAISQELLSRDQFLDSSRGPDCKVRGKKTCDDTMGMKRRKSTSSMHLTSPVKLKFDIAQLRYIAFEKLDLTDMIIGKILPSMQILYKKVSDIAIKNGLSFMQFIDMETHKDVLVEASAKINKGLHENTYI